MNIVSPLLTCREAADKLRRLQRAIDERARISAPLAAVIRGRQ